MVDRTTKLLLAAVAAGLFLNAAAAWMPLAHATEGVCRIEGPVEVRITEFRDEVSVEWGFSQPGSSSSSPLYVRQSQKGQGAIPGAPGSRLQAPGSSPAEAAFSRQARVCRPCPAGTADPPLPVP